MKLLLVIPLCLGLASCISSTDPSGKAWQDTQQILPGKLECEWYDEGGEGQAYHDTDAVNNGSGKLNPANGNFLHEFRMKEGVDISFTKTGGIDDNPFNITEPRPASLYVGWTVPGEWINYQVDIKEAGPYLLTFMYTANADGVIALEIDNQPLAPAILIPSTHNPQDTVAWRQWHHWRSMDLPTPLSLPNGRHTIKLRILERGNMNFDYIVFKKA